MLPRVVQASITDWLTQRHRNTEKTADAKPLCVSVSLCEFQQACTSRKSSWYYSPPTAQRGEGPGEGGHFGRDEAGRSAARPPQLPFDRPRSDSSSASFARHRLPRFSSDVRSTSRAFRTISGARAEPSAAGAVERGRRFDSRFNAVRQNLRPVPFLPSQAGPRAFRNR